MIIKLCARCKKPTVYPARYCSTCSPIVERERQEREEKERERSMKKYNQQRDPKFSSFYKSKSWRMMSSRYMQDHGFKCESCGSLATDVHHVIPIQIPEGWDRRFDVGNLRALCVECHNKEHGRFIRKNRTDRKPEGYMKKF